VGILRLRSLILLPLPALRAILTLFGYWHGAETTYAIFSHFFSFASNYKRLTLPKCKIQETHNSGLYGRKLGISGTTTETCKVAIIRKQSGSEQTSPQLPLPQQQ